LLRKGDELDRLAETNLLSQQELDFKQSIKERLAQLLREEEIKWFQRAKTKELLKGDDNRKYFQMVANGKRRKTRIYRLEQEGGVIEGEENLKKYIIEYYKGLFGRNEKSSLSLDESQIDDLAQVTGEDNAILTKNLSEQKVREAIFQMKYNKAPGPDGFQAEFY
jgi:hypothetical protein